MAENVIKVTGASIISGLTYLLGGWDMAIEVFCIMVVLDYLTGIMKGITTKNLSSYIGLKGIFKKICLFILIAVAVQLEKLTNQPETIHVLLCYFLVVNEAISILENVKAMGITVPNFLTKYLERLKGKEDDDET